MKRGRIPRGYVKFEKGMLKKLQHGDKVVVDLGGIELASGKLDTLSGRHKDSPVEFWSYSGWRHMELAKISQIKFVKFNK